MLLVLPLLLVLHVLCSVAGTVLLLLPQVTAALLILLPCLVVLLLLLEPGLLLPQRWRVLLWCRLLLSFL
jgi:hypothetical protein